MHNKVQPSTMKNFPKNSTCVPPLMETHRHPLRLALHTLLRSELIRKAEAGREVLKRRKKVLEVWKSVEILSDLTWSQRINLHTSRPQPEPHPHHASLNCGHLSTPHTCWLSGFDRSSGGPMAGIRKRRVASIRALRIALTCKDIVWHFVWNDE